MQVRNLSVAGSTLKSQTHNNHNQMNTFSQDGGWSDAFVSNTSNFQRCRIIYSVKKAFLDKLDLILQKLNLEVLTTMETHNIKSFKLISMTQLEQEISDLFEDIENTIAFRQPIAAEQNTAALIKQNQVLRSEILHLNQMLEESKSQVPSSKRVSELQDQVTNLNTQIKNYEAMDRSLPRALDAGRNRRVASKLWQLQGEIAKLKLEYVGILKSAKQLQLGFDSFRMDIGEKVVTAVVDEKRKLHSLMQENQLLRQQIENWSYDIQNYVQQKLEGVLG